LKDSYAEIILVFGCGGDRDKSKRPKMMKVALGFASEIFFTSDNNRNELFSSIADEAMDGVITDNIQIIEDRGQAIQLAFQSLNQNSILVILGKGHEMFMEVSGQKLPFNDRNCVLKISENEIN
jgi:UDP-N-acetylmuramoyl-L-alanyl-D-glutamate--2,6-diaminopimelate ligase